MSDINIEELVDAYIAIRNERDRLTLEYEDAVSVIKGHLSDLEVAMLGLCNDMKADSIKTKNGTVIRSLKERAVCGDWDNFKQFVQEHDAVDLLERRIHQGNFKEFMSQNPDAGLPPGINLMREFGIVVRKINK